jgi:hypothetical protein
MNDKFIWMLSPAVFSIIGMVAGYLMHPDYTIVGTFGGFVGGFLVACFAMAGEGRDKK